MNDEFNVEHRRARQRAASIDAAQTPALHPA
jgi:hypothetical protein